VSAASAITQYITLVHHLKKSGISLVVMVLNAPGRIKKSDVANYNLLLKTTMVDVPKVVFFNIKGGFAKGRSFEQWWGNNSHAYEEAGLQFDRVFHGSLAFDDYIENPAEHGPRSKYLLHHAYSNAIPHLLSAASATPIQPRALWKSYVAFKATLWNGVVGILNFFGFSIPYEKDHHSDFTFSFRSALQSVFSKNEVAMISETVSQLINLDGDGEKEVSCFVTVLEMCRARALSGPCHHQGQVTAP
jgi:hypothetical protein